MIVVARLWLTTCSISRVVYPSEGTNSSLNGGRIWDAPCWQHLHPKTRRKLGCCTIQSARFFGAVQIMDWGILTICWSETYTKVVRLVAEQNKLLKSSDSVSLSLRHTTISMSHRSLSRSSISYYTPRPLVLAGNFLKLNSHSFWRETFLKLSLNGFYLLAGYCHMFDFGESRNRTGSYVKVAISSLKSW